MTDLNFDSIKHLNPYNVEYWQARELMPLLGYATRWQNFESVIKKAMISCEQTGNIITDHFTDASKMIETGKGAHRQVKDYYLSRLACYLIAMNGDPRKEEVATAQNYFAVSTRSHEIHQLYQEQQARIEIRMQVAEGNKNLSEAAAQAGVRSESFGIFHDSGLRMCADLLQRQEGIALVYLLSLRLFPGNGSEGCRLPQHFLNAGDRPGNACAKWAPSAGKAAPDIIDKNNQKSYFH